MKKKKQPKLSYRAARAYGRRNNTLRKLGFDSYRAYLQSPLWRDIRARVLAGDPLCSVCRVKPATQVHHRQYDMDTLLGKTLQRLVPICRDCHETSEVGRNGKNSLRQANHIQEWMRGMLKRQRWEHANFHLPNRQFLKGK